MEEPVYIEKPVYIPSESPVEKGVVNNFSIVRNVPFSHSVINEVVTG